MATVVSVNVGTGRTVGTKVTGIDKRPVDGPIRVQAPGGPRGAGSGLAGDEISSGRYHGGDDQAVYAYAREDLDLWAGEIGRPLANGVFGENLTTLGVDVNGAWVGERWAVGPELVLEVSAPRVPCGTFQTWIGERGWIKRFNRAALPGTYLRVIRPGSVAAGQGIVVSDRPDHDVTVAVLFRALTLEPELLPGVLVADALPEHIKKMARLAAV